MRYFRHEAGPKEKEVTLYPLVCWHRGSKASDDKLITRVIERIKRDPTARWIYMGDGGEVVTKASKGDVFSQTMSPQEQLNDLVRLLKPIQDKGLFAIRGNHGHRTYKDTGLEFDESLALALQVPYLGLSAFWHMKIQRSLYSIYTHHGSDSGATISSKINAAKKPEAFIQADAIITAHSHIVNVLPPRLSVRLDTSSHRADAIKWTATHNYIAGSAYDGRRDPENYGEEKLYSPILPAHLAIRFTGDVNANKSQTPEVIQAEV